MRKRDRSMRLVGEYSAFIITFILLICYFDKRRVMTPQAKLYAACLYLSLVSIVVDVVCHYLLARTDVPIWLNMGLNSAYFILTVAMCSTMAWYLFHKILEHVYDHHCLRRALWVVGSLFVAFWMIVVANIRTGWLFWFDGEGVYHRGILNGAGYVVLLLEMVFVLVCYFKNRSSVSKIVVKALWLTFPVTILMVIYQRRFPELMMNGMLMAVANLILFVNFQSQKLGVDTLTNLNDRRSFYTEIALRMAGEQHFQVIFITLKNFKTINQRYGYEKGDELLYQAAKFLESFLKSSRAFHMGNVSFALVCPYLNDDQAQKNLDLTGAGLEKDWKLGEISIRLDSVLADMVYQGQQIQPSELIEKLEYTLRLAKDANLRVLHYTEKIGKELERRQYLIESLKTAREEERLRVWYQPIYNWRTGGFSSAEALVRMLDGDGTIIGPQEFISLAEETGMVDTITWFVLEEVCRFMAAHSAFPLETVSVNLPVAQFLDQELEEKIQRTLRKYGISEKKIKLEITERTVLNDQQYVQGIMEKLRRRGIEFYMDDFGVGYSNFSSVTHLPFESIKLDKSLIDHILEDKKSLVTVRMLTDLFHQIEMQVVAEGVESEEQVKILESLGIDRFQGYYFAKPMPEGDLCSLYQS